MYRVASYKRLNYRSFDDLHQTISQNISKIDFEVDLVVGVPRSGIIPATIISLLLHKPFVTLTEFINEFEPIGGMRTSGFQYRKKNVLLVDDSINSGNAINQVKKSISLFHDIDFKFAAIYSTPDASNKIDVFFEIVNSPRIFQWNVLNSWIYSKSCVDIDGVLCEDPTEYENDDSLNYIHFLLNAKPKYIPPVPVDILVTNRLEKYRKETVIWLNKNGIKYNELHMSPHKSKIERQRAKDYSSFKANVYLKNKSKSLLFIESSYNQAVSINSITKLPVFCIESMSLIDEFVNQDKFQYLKTKYFNKIWKFFGVDV
ncbi:phosphoribosyltransferase family protein [Algoriphagus machipongonensis]|uniref:Orotate phosphoribosyltransferase n=1 Tax=Algoriphagus machipongonensis TaxID=388413 RepID=A3HRI1_9BACT|nr:phosphoribosyltransferase family protein [Algoriphagus machipongonensis]EAZ82449.1 putative orotate phosphoribosyltransferase [Algoriphagus machipongonensis]